jgi:hypothetical protein
VSAKLFQLSETVNFFPLEAFPGFEILEEFLFEESKFKTWPMHNAMKKAEKACFY